MAVAESRAAGANARAERPSRWRAHLPLLVALIGVFAAQARTLAFFYFQDDYTPYGEIVTHGTRAYLWNLVTAQDLTPNWRVLPGLLYLADAKLFHMTPLAPHIVLLAAHVGTVALLYRAVWRATTNAWPAFTAAVVFGLHPTYAGVLGQVAVAPHVFGAFFLVATLNAVLECSRAESSGEANRWWAAAVVLYVLALMSNESMAIIFPAFGLAYLLFDDDPDHRNRLVRATIRTLPLAIIGFAAAISFSACSCTEADAVYSTDSAVRVFFIYGGRILYPVGLEPPSYIDPPHLHASTALLSVAALVLVRGSALGRVGAVWMVLAIIPHIFVSTHTANRFTYLATPGFAMMAASIVAAATLWLRRIDTRAPAVATVIALVVVAPLYAWQTHLENEPWRRTTDDWHLLHDELEREFPDVPTGSTVEVIGGPLTHPLDNFFVMPALGYTIWGPDVRLQTFAEDDPYTDNIRRSQNPYAAEFDGRDLIRLDLR